MLGPLDVQVLINRTLEVQKIQGNVLRRPEEEGEVFKERVAREVKDEERRVRRRSQVVSGRVDDKERQNSHKREDEEDREGRSAEREVPTGSRRKNPAYYKGSIIDFQL